jgi:hypothetical protein
LSQFGLAERLDAVSAPRGHADVVEVAVGLDAEIAADACSGALAGGLVRELERPKDEANLLSG